MRRAQLSVRRQMWYVTAGGQSYGVSPSLPGVSPADAGHAWLRAGLLHSADAATGQRCRATSARLPNSGGYGLAVCVRPALAVSDVEPGHRHERILPRRRLLHSGSSSRRGSARESASSGTIRRTTACRVPMACSGSPISTGRSWINGSRFRSCRAASVPSIFVSQEDVVWVEALQSNAFSPVLPDLQLAKSSPDAPVDRLALFLDVHRISGELEPAARRSRGTS